MGSVSMQQTMMERQHEGPVTLTRRFCVPVLVAEQRRGDESVPIEVGICEACIDHWDHWSGWLLSG